MAKPNSPDGNELDEALAQTAQREAARQARRLKEAEERAAQFRASANKFAQNQKNFSPVAPQPHDNRDRDTIIVDRDKIDANPNQPRRRFNEDDLKSLGESLRNDGQLQALVVRPHPTRHGRYQLVSGERRWRAAGQKYGDVERLRVTVRDLDDEQVLRLGLIENVQRSDLTALEKARALAQLKVSPQGDKSLRDLETETGLKKSQIQRLLALLDLPEAIIKRFDDLNLNEIHGRALLSLNSDRRAQNQLMHSIEQGEMSGNEAQRVAESLKAPVPPDTPPASGPSTWTTTTPPASTSNAPATSGSGMVTSGGDASAAARSGVSRGESVSRETEPQAATKYLQEAREHIENALEALEKYADIEGQTDMWATARDDLASVHGLILSGFK